MLLFRKKMAISVRFRLRPAQGDAQPRQLAIQARISIEGAVDPGFSTGLKCSPAQWDANAQQVTGRSDEAVRVNKLLVSMKNRLLQVFDRQQERWELGEGPRPTPDTVKFEYKNGTRPPLDFSKESRRSGPVIGGDVTLLAAYRLYVADMKARKPAVPDGTIRSWELGLEKMILFLGSDKDKRAVSVNRKWANNYFQWMLNTKTQHKKTREPRTMQPQSAAVYVSQVRKLLNFLVEQDIITVSPLHNYRKPATSSKEVYFLEMHHLDALFGLKLSCTLNNTCWWLKLICLTGLDYVDAKKYVKDREKYEVVRSGRKQIRIRRNKKPHNECIIPYLPELDILFAEFPAGPFASTLINYNLKDLQKLIGFEKPLTCKIGRKTAGAWFLWRGYRLEAVSKILGHSSIVTTQKHYVSITSTVIDLEMERLGA